MMPGLTLLLTSALLSARRSSRAKSLPADLSRHKVPLSADEQAGDCVEEAIHPDRSGCPVIKQRFLYSYEDKGMDSCIHMENSEVRRVRGSESLVRFEYNFLDP